MAGNIKLAVNNARTHWNDAELRGEDAPEWQALLERRARFIERHWDRIKQRGWRSKEKTWREWFEDSLTWHREDIRKDGAGYVFGTSANGERAAENMRHMVAIGLDIEPEQPLSDVIDRCEASGLAIVLYTSHNHARTTDCEKVDTILKYGEEISTATVRDFLRSKKTYSEAFISQCELVDPRADIDGKKQCVWSCPPLQKMRAVALLDEPVDVSELHPSPKKGGEIWANKVRGIADLLGVTIDPVATDPSRILYVAKHRTNAEWYCAVFQGRPVRWEEIPEKAKGENNPYLKAAKAIGSSSIPDVITSTGVDVTALYRSYGKRWMLADMLAGSHVAKEEASDRLHVECPFSDEHTSESGPTSTTVWNAPDSEYGYAMALCQHTCKERYHTVDYVRRWIEDEVIDPAWLEAPSFMADTPEPPGPFEELTPSELGEEGSAGESKTPEQRAEAFNSESSEEDIRKFIKKLFREGVDLTVQANVTAVLAKGTNLGKREIKKFWKELEEELRKREKDQEFSGGMYITEPAPDQTRYAADAARAANENSPFLFEYMEAPAIVRRGRLKTLDRAGRRHELGKVTTFWKPKGEGELQHVYPPYDVVDDLFSSDLSEFALPLRGVVDTPFFAADGTLVTANGYHAGSQMYLDSELVLAGVSPRPTAEEAQEAARFIVEECLADFPLGGLTRQEIMEKTFTPSGVPAVANSLTFILLHFARNMIRGATPGHVVNKPAPGTGAGYLVDVCTTIRSGAPAPALPMPKNKDELAKTLTAVLLDGEPAVFFDNINHEMDSAELASAMTPPDTGYRARILGKTQTALVQIMSSWVFAANTLTMSDELLRRCILIDLDRKAVDPAKFVPEGGWRHKDVRTWTLEHRAGLVHACLTIIQHWVAEGMQRSDHTLASFENWAGVMGGILKAAGVGGFMGNQSELTGLSDGRDDEMSSVMQAIAGTMHGNADARLYIGSKTDEETAAGKFGMFDILHAMEDTPRLDQWGYREVFTGDETEVRYENTRKAGLRFKAAAKRTYRVEIGGKAYEARFVQEHDSKANAKCYRLELNLA
ncbi:hypothetical protein ACSQ76_08265 [Roseovarius sp. B08]|uniref:hypothetical protein n=1 Tax=Roseovarius sp. B08 TaxID=3449223 RepID=UPI003EDB72AE